MEKLTDIARINSLLKRLLDSRTLITINIENYQQSFSTAIIKLSIKNGYFLLDELKPENGDEILRKSNNFRVSVQLEGVSIRFSASVSEFGDEDGLPYYKVQVPKSMDYYQRRAAVRIKLSAANPINISLTPEEGETFKGEMTDLSNGGFGASFKKSLPSNIDKGDILKCTFPLPHDNKQLFTSEVIVRMIRHKAEKSGPAFIGGEFYKLDKSLERQLQRAIMNLQRLAQKKR